MVNVVWLGDEWGAKMQGMAGLGGVESYVRRGQEMAAATERQRVIMAGRKFDTIAVHGVYNMEAALANQGSIIEPVTLSTSQHFENSDHMEAGLAYLMPAWAYTRIANPTIHYLEETLALLEGYGFDSQVSTAVTSSGMAAIFMATNPFLSVEPAIISRNGRNSAEPLNFVASARCYGGAFTLFSQRYAAERGVEVRWVRDPLNLDEWGSRIDRNTRFIYGEMPSNPGLAVFDIPGVAALAHAHDLPLIVDATIATPALLRPITLGADIVVQSLTKTLGSSGLAIAGALSARHHIASRVGSDELRADFARHVRQLPLRDFGPSLSPFNAFMLLNDMRTLRSKVDRLSRSAQVVAEFLAGRPQVEQVFYPGLPDAMGHEVARRDMWLVDGEDDYGAPVNRFGHLLSFTVRGGATAARRVLDRFQMIWRATDLGRIKSIATIPAISTHQQQGDAGRDLAQVPGHLIRLNVGGEHPADIMADLEQALDDL